MLVHMEEEEMVRIKVELVYYFTSCVVIPLIILFLIVKGHNKKKNKQRTRKHARGYRGRRIAISQEINATILNGGVKETSKAQR
jgi:hypothetical protein